jgi:hypothetical protein
VHASHDDDVRVGFRGHPGEGERVAAQVRDAVVDVRRHVVVRQHDRATLCLQCLDLGDQRLDDGDFEVGQDAGQAVHGTHSIYALSEYLL